MFGEWDRDFHSLRTGKHCGTVGRKLQPLRRWCVSIPYERESTSEPTRTSITPPSLERFPFPTNGKAHLNSFEGVLYRPSSVIVSIPYERESTSERIGITGKIRSLSVSIPYERESTSELENQEKKLMRYMVSIPYERESTSEQSNPAVENRNRHVNVSIPYERESTSELMRNFL